MNRIPLAYIAFPVQELVAMAKAFADPTRVRILSALQKGELCVCELRDALEIPQSTLSTHSQVIRDSGLVQTRKEGKWVYYVLAPEKTALTDSLFIFFAEGLSRDKTISADKSRLKARLNCRENGECRVGFKTFPQQKAKQR